MRSRLTESSRRTPRLSLPPSQHTQVGRRREPSGSWGDDRGWMVSWMSMNRIDQYPGRGSGNSCRAQKNPVNVTAAAESQMITPAARTHGVDPDDITMRPAMATASARYPTRRAQTAVLKCPLCCSSGGSSMPGIVREPRVCDHWRPVLIFLALPRRSLRTRRRRQRPPVRAEPQRGVGRLACERAGLFARVRISWLDSLILDYRAGSGGWVEGTLLVRGGWPDSGGGLSLA